MNKGVNSQLLEQSAKLRSEAERQLSYVDDLLSRKASGADVKGGTETKSKERSGSYDHKRGIDAAKLRQDEDIYSPDRHPARVKESLKGREGSRLQENHAGDARDDDEWVANRGRDREEARPMADGRPEGTDMHHGSTTKHLVKGPDDEAEEDKQAGSERRPAEPSGELASTQVLALTSVVVLFSS
eukprot:757231-Hanusia_phi.AAC.5